MVKQNIYIILLGLKLLFILLSGILFTVSLNETLDDPNFISNFYSYCEEEKLTREQMYELEYEFRKKLEWKEPSDSDVFEGIAVMIIDIIFWICNIIVFI